ncbi:protein translocase subunit SecF [Desulfuromonas soudanensis]|uniref:Protein-export membrane protein SecF n=1 Tax=Desulfuromonas soudanensis TaxID=1603606 RepID=A0A0M3QG87_9BACT|nr:protein translocase subunit SecF [Desulfuromonas soudanensis]ALC17383.1 protein translocase subunit SecF [Desulfuromonas soudanensis]
MEIIRPQTNIDFVGKNRIAVIISLVVIAAGLLSLLIQGGPKYGVDFAGGTLIQVRFVAKTQAGDIKDALVGLGLTSLTVQQFGDSAEEFLIRTPEAGGSTAQLSQKFKQALEAKYGTSKLEILRSEMVGPQVGKDLRQKGLLAVVYALLGTLIYVAWRFEFRFGVAAIVALAHDVLVTLGFFSLFGKEIDLPIIAAFLAIIGYSLNDTIIIYDRIREEIAKSDGEGLAVIVNRSINQTLSRTILTSGTTLLVVVSLFIFGGGVIHDFAFAMLVGIIAGTYSSIFVASALLLFWEKRLPRKAGGNISASNSQ